MNPVTMANIHLAECQKHADILGEALAELSPNRPFTSADMPLMRKDLVRLLDQIAYRFAKCQDTLGQKLLPLILELAQEPLPPEATFAEKLNRLERLSVIPSASEWKQLRAARNAIAHEYPDEPAIGASAINAFLHSAERLRQLQAQIAEYIRIHFPAAPGK